MDTSSICLLYTSAADYSYLCAVFAGYDDTKGLAADDVVASDDGKTLTVKLKAVTPYLSLIHI